MNFAVIWGLFLGLSCTAIPLAFAIGLTPLLFFLGTGKYTPAVIFQSIVGINESLRLSCEGVWPRSSSRRIKELAV